MIFDTTQNLKMYDKVPPDKIASRIETNLQAYGKTALKVAPTGIPDYKTWLANARAKAIPHKTIIDHVKPPISATISQAQPGLFDDTDKQYVTAKLDMTGYEKRPDLTTHPVRQYVSNSIKYVPKGGHSPFISGSAAPIPPVVNQSCIKAAADAYSIARHMGKDPENINKLFRWMWNLPKDFTLEPYALQVDSTITKPWLRLKQSENYEVCYMPAQQGMIKVTTGSEIGVHTGIKWDVDWEWVRTCARSIMTRILFIESHRFNLEQLNGLELKFLVRYDSFLPQSTPKLTYNVPDTVNPFNIPDAISAELYAANKITLETYSGTTSITKYLDDLKPLSKPIISTLPTKLVLSEGLSELGTWFGPPPSMKFVEPVELTDKAITRKPLTIKALIAQYVTQRCLRSPKLCELLFEVKARMELGDDFKARMLLGEFFDKNELNGVLLLYMRMHNSSLACVRDIWELFTGGKNPGKLIRAIDANSLLQQYVSCDVDLLSLTCFESLRELRRNMAAPNILLMLKYMGLRLNLMDKPDIVKAKIKDLITTFYIANYRSKVHALTDLYIKEPDKDAKKLLKKKLILRQSLLRFYASNFKSNKQSEWEQNMVKTLRTLSYKYVAKRKRLQRKLQDLENDLLSRKENLSYISLAQIYDDVLHTSFVEGIKLAEQKIKATEEDLDLLFMTQEDYNIFYGKHVRSTKRFRLIMNSMTQQYMKAKPDYDIFDLEEDKKETVRTLLFEDNESYVPYENLTYKGRMPKIMENRPKWMSRTKFVEVKERKLKNVKRVKQKKALVIANDEPTEIIPLEDIKYHPKILANMLTAPADKEPEPPPKPPDIEITLPSAQPVEAQANLDDMFGDDDYDDLYQDNTNKVTVGDYISSKYLPWTVGAFMKCYLARNPNFTYDDSHGFLLSELDALRADQTFSSEVLADSNKEFGGRATQAAKMNVDIQDN